MKTIPKRHKNKPSFWYFGFTFLPAYNFEELGWDTKKNEECTHLKLQDPCLDFLNHHYSYKEFYKKAPEKKDIYYCVETQRYYCPCGGAFCEIAID